MKYIPLYFSVALLIFLASCKKENIATNSTNSKYRFIDSIIGDYFVRYHSYQIHSYIDSNGVYQGIIYTYPSDTAFINITISKGNTDSSIVFLNNTYTCDSINAFYKHFSNSQFKTISILGDSIYSVDFLPSPRFPSGKVWEGKKQ